QGPADRREGLPLSRSQLPAAARHRVLVGSGRGMDGDAARDFPARLVMSLAFIREREFMWRRCFGLALIACLCGAPAARALDKVNAGTAVWPIWAFLPLQVGLDHGIWPQYGIDLSITNTGSAAKLIQALTAGSVDVGLSSGVEMAFAAKGASIRAVA